VGGAAALFLPVMERISQRTGAPIRRLLMPMGFAATLGGTFGLMVAIAASNAFVLPTHQVNALLLGPGGYRVADESGPAPR
jgi:di/tricarboxylate transporter